jgi:hypothetical protein
VVCVSSTVSCNTAACSTRTSVIPVDERKFATALMDQRRKIGRGDGTDDRMVNTAFVSSNEWVTACTHYGV